MNLPDSHSTLLEMRDVSFLREGKTVLSHVDFVVNRGDFIAITGPNGGGKTTMLRLILGLLKPDSGEILYYGPDCQRTSKLEHVGYLPQKNSVDSHFPINVREVIASGLMSLKSLNAAVKNEMIQKALELTELQDLATRPIGRLSGGQLQRALLGRAIVAKPSVLVLDEPLSYIDRHFEEHLYSIMERIAKESTVLLVSHQMTHIGAMANRHIIIDHTLRECGHAHHFVQPEC